MMGHTDRHFRFMANLLAKDIKLYTPMIHADTIVFSENQLLETETESANLRYTENRWVSINHRTGTVTSEVLADIGSAMKFLPNPGNLTFADKVGLSRELVRTGTGLEDD